MADFNPNEIPAATKPVSRGPGAALRGAVQRSIVSHTLAGQAIGSRLMLPTVPKGARGVQHRLQSSVSLGASTVALGATGNVGKYRAAATLAVTTPEDVSSAVNTAAVLTADEVQFLTVGAAALPVGGTLAIETTYNI